MKPRTNLFLPSALLAVIASLGAANHAQAQTTYQWNGSPTASSDWTTSANWANPGVGATGGIPGATFNARLNVYSGSGSQLTYSSAQGTTVYANGSGRGLVISRANPFAAGAMEITGGSFSTLGSTQADVIGNNATGSLTVSGTGSFIGAASFAGGLVGTSAGGTLVGLNSGGGTSTLTVSGNGSATISTLYMAAATATVNLNGGTLTANQIVDVDNLGATGNSNTTFNFNGGTLKAGPDAATAFMTGLTNAYVLSAGAKIDTNGKNITIGQALLAGSPSGGLTLDDTAVTKGTLTLTNSNTYTGATTVTNGKLVVNGSISTSSLTTVDAAGTLAGIGTVGAATIIGDLAPGDGGIESLNFGGNLTLAGTSTFEISAAANTADLAISSAVLAFGGVLNVSNIAGTLANGQSFDLFNWGTTTGTFSAVNLPTLDSGLTWDQSSLYTNGTITVVPEPSAALLGGLGMLALLRRRR